MISNVKLKSSNFNDWHEEIQTFTGNVNDKNKYVCGKEDIGLWEKVWECFKNWDDCERTCLKEHKYCQGTVYHLRHM